MDTPNSMPFLYMIGHSFTLKRKVDLNYYYYCEKHRQIFFSSYTRISIEASCNSAELKEHADVWAVWVDGFEILIETSPVKRSRQGVMSHSSAIQSTHWSMLGFRFSLSISVIAVPRSILVNHDQDFDDSFRCSNLSCKERSYHLELSSLPPSNHLLQTWTCQFPPDTSGKQT